MTEDEAISLAESVARSEGWPWTGPVRAIRHRHWLVGPVYWEVISNAAAIGSNVRVKIEDATGEVFQKKFLPR